MQSPKSPLAILVLTLVALAARPALCQDADPLARIDTNLVTAAAYLDVLRDNDAVAPQVIERNAAVLVVLAGQRNDLVTQRRQAEAWRARQDDGATERDVLERAVSRADHRLSPSDRAKTRMYVRRMDAALAAVSERLSSANGEGAHALEQLVGLSDGLVAHLAALLREHGYESELRDDVVASREDYEGPAWRVGDTAKVAAVVRRMQTLLAGIPGRMQDAASARTRAYEQMATSIPQFGQTIEEMLGHDAGTA